MGFCLCVGAAGARADETQPATDAGVTAFPEFPAVQLARSKSAGLDDSEKYWAGRVAMLVEQSAKAADAGRRVELLLGAANLVLGRQLEPFCTRRAAGLPAREADADAVRDLLTRFDEIFDQARPAVTGMNPPDPRLTQITAALESLAQAQRSFLLEDHAADRRRAASALAPMLEDSDKRVAEAARLWQVLLRGSESDPGPALQILDQPMVPPSPESWPYGLYAKVLRCRYQATQGRWSAALVMLTHIEDQLDSWVPDLAHRGDARRLFAYLRLETLKRWHDAMPPDRAAERAWCAAQADQAARAYFDVDASILRLDPAVPMLLPDEILKTGEPVEPEIQKH